MSLLTICQDVADGVGIARPSSIVSNTNGDARTLLYHAKKSLQGLCDAYPWNVLVTEGSITLATGDQDYALPSDFARFVPDTTYDRTDQRPVEFPVTGQEWAWLKGWEIVTSLNRRARLIGGELEFYEEITSAYNGRSIHFEYISKNKAASSSGTAKETFTADTDTARIPEHLVTLDMVWRYKRDKGLEFERNRQEFKDEFQRYQGFNRTSKGLDMARQSVPVLGALVSDRGYG